MRIGTVSRTVSDPQATLDDLVAEFKTAEAQGFAFVSLPNIFGLDAIGALTVVGRETERIELITGVVPSPPRHPAAMAQQALTAQAASKGRFVLGIGLSHKIVIEGMFGLSYARPAAQMREYLEVLVPLLQGRQADFEGEFYRVHASLAVAGVSSVPILIAALGPLMLRVAGQMSDGTSTWMTGPKTLAELTVPTIRKAASEAGRAEPRILAALPCAITRDAARAREIANKAFQIYGTLPSYRAMLDYEGAASPGDVAIVGSEGDVRRAIDRLRDAGVTDFAGIPFSPEDGSVERTLELLQSLL